MHLVGLEGGTIVIMLKQSSLTNVELQMNQAIKGISLLLRGNHLSLSIKECPARMDQQTWDILG